jgi:hypothetical protein
MPVKKKNEEGEKLPQKVLDAIKSYPAQWTGGICAYAYVSRDGQHTLYDDNHACHAGLSILSGNHWVKDDKYLNSYVILACSDKYQGKHPEFVKWVCRESPYAYGVLNADNEDEILNHGVVVDSELVGQRGCLWLGKALRYCREDTWRPGLWETFVANGLDGLAAFIGCSMLTEAGRPSGGTHNSLFVYRTPKEIHDWYKKFSKPAEKADDSDAAQGRMHGAAPSWGELGFKIEKKSDGWGGFTEKRVPADPKNFCEVLDRICKKGEVK